MLTVVIMDHQGQYGSVEKVRIIRNKQIRRKFSFPIGIFLYILRILIIQGGRRSGKISEKSEKSWGFWKKSLKN